MLKKLDNHRNKMKYIFDIERDYEKIESYQEEDNNLAKIEIIDPNGKIINGKDYRILILLTKEALLGLGTELIRYAHHCKNDNQRHLRRITKDKVIQNMGIYLTPESNELIISCNNLGKIDDYITNK